MKRSRIKKLSPSMVKVKGTAKNRNASDYRITRPRENKDRTVELDGSLIADAAMVARDGKPMR